MKKLFNRLYSIFNKKNTDNVVNICSSTSGDLNDYCSLEYTYIKRDSI